jgi:hypothetical protein
LLAELGFELWIGDPAEIKAKRVKKQKYDRNDARLLRRLMLENNFPQIWVPSPENRDLRQLLWHRHRLVQKDAFAWSLEDISFVNGKPRITVRDISDYILLLYMNDCSADRLRVCINPGCKMLKYFVKERRNQKFCSVGCKNSFHVNTWLATPANRRKWNEYRRVGSR